jgi:hypothetical protein
MGITFAAPVRHLVTNFRREPRYVRHGLLCAAAAAVFVTALAFLIGLGDPFTWHIVTHGLIAAPSQVNPSGFAPGSWYVINDSGWLAFAPEDHHYSVPIFTALTAIGLGLSALGLVLNFTIGRYEAGAEPGVPLR